jgi:AAA15 family ATPase/GTPase
MGENNSGKTSILQATWFALSSLYQGKLISVDARTNQVKVSKSGYFMFDVPFVPQGDLSSLFYGKISRTGPSYNEDSGAILEIVDNRNNVIRIHMREMFTNLHFKVLTQSTDLYNPTIQSFQPLYISGNMSMRFREERIFPATLAERTSTGNISELVRNLILDLKLHDYEKYSSLANMLKNDFGFEISDIHFHEDTERFISSEYLFATDSHYIRLDFSSSGSGLIQIIQILAVIYKYCPEKTSVVLIDEPDAHLHSNLQVKFSNILRKLQKELGIQIIISTHSTAIIQNAEPYEVIPISACNSVNRGLSGSDEVQQNIVDRLDAYELGKAKISGKIAFFEDENLDIYKKMAEVARINCFNGINTIPIINGRGKDDKLPFSLSPVLRQLLGRDIEIHVVRDADGLSEETISKLRAYAATNNVVLHILSNYEIENYILNAELIQRALLEDNAENTVPSVEELQAQIVKFCGESVTGGIHKYQTTLQDSLYKVKYGLLGITDYRPNQAAHEADELYRNYYHCSDATEFCRIGMGKEALSLLLAWLREKKSLRISKKKIISSISDADVPIEIKGILSSLTSALASPVDFDNIDRDQLPAIDGITEPQEQLSIDELVEMQSR